MRRFITVVFATMMLLSIGQAQVPPAWVNVGDLPYGRSVYDILGIPGTNVLVAGGTNGSYIWRSPNGGQSWTLVCDIYGGTQGFHLFVRDTISGRIWAIRGSTGANTICFSNDTGRTWTGVSTPFSSPGIYGHRIEIVGDYVYFGGSVTTPYSTCLYRLHQTTLQWELVIHYPQCNIVDNLKYYNNKLIVIARDKTQTFNRVFTHTLAELDKRAIPIGKAETSEEATKEEK